MTNRDEMIRRLQHLVDTCETPAERNEARCRLRKFGIESKDEAIPIQPKVQEPIASPNAWSATKTALVIFAASFFFGLFFTSNIGPTGGAIHISGAMGTAIGLTLFAMTAFLMARKSRSQRPDKWAGGIALTIMVFYVIGASN